MLTWFWTPDRLRAFIMKSDVYEPPSLSVLGSVSALTLTANPGGGGNKPSSSPDGMSGTVGNHSGHS